MIYAVLLSTSQSKVCRTAYLLIPLSVYHAPSHAVIMNIDTVSYNTITIAFHLMSYCVIVLPEAESALVLGPNKSLLEHLVFFNVAFECMF